VIDLDRTQSINPDDTFVEAETELDENEMESVFESTFRIDRDVIE
jgi:hypothetical protein